MRKRWVVLVLLAIVAAAWAWPYAGAYSLARAAAANDSVAVSERVDFPALRHSLAHEVIRAYLKRSGRGNKLGGLGQGLAEAVGTTVADPYLSELIAPDTVTTLLGSGHLKNLTIDQRTVTFDRTLPRFPDLMSRSIWPVILSSYYDGPISFVFHGAGGDDEQYGVHLRLSGATWKLSGVDLPQPMLDRIADDIIAKERDNKQS